MRPEPSSWSVRQRWRRRGDGGVEVRGDTTWRSAHSETHWVNMTLPWPWLAPRPSPALRSSCTSIRPVQIPWGWPAPFQTQSGSQRRSIIALIGSLQHGHNSYSTARRAPATGEETQIPTGKTLASSTEGKQFKHKIGFWFFFLTISSAHIQWGLSQRSICMATKRLFFSHIYIAPVSKISLSFPSWIPVAAFGRHAQVVGLRHENTWAWRNQTCVCVCLVDVLSLCHV